MGKKIVAVGALATLMIAAACSTSPTVGTGTKLEVVATINAWGSIAAQLGGDRVHTTSLISNPATDPHDYEPSASDARTVAGAKVVVANGAGYDAWMDKLTAANPSPNRIELTVSTLVGIPEGGNPHQWYSPDSVARVVDAITADYQKAAPADAAYFAQQKQKFLSEGLARYHSLIADIKNIYTGTPIGASESIVTPLAQALGLNLITPTNFLKATSEGSDPAPADKAVIDRELSDKAIAVYVYNSQNATPDIRTQVDAARAHGIPVTTVTETLAPAGTTFQDWQATQLAALKDALHTATGK